MLKKLIYIASIILLAISIKVFADTTFDIDENFFVDTGISSGDYSAIHFGYGGNSADGIAFWSINPISTGTLILSWNTINCNQQIEWLYINNIRWNKVWPLDQNTLNELSGSSNFSGYDTLTITWWFFTDCSGTWVDSTDNVYGYVEHTYNGETFRLWAGVDYDFDNNTIIWNFSGSLAYISGNNLTMSWYLFDNYGWIANVYSNEALNGNIVWSGNNITLSGWDYYTNETWLIVNIWSNENGNFSITGDLISGLNWVISAWNYLDQNIEINTINNEKTITLNLSTGSSSYAKSISINFDNTAPTLAITDGVDSNPNASDTVVVTFDDATVKRYKIISNSGDCNTTITWTSEYTGDVVINTDIYNWDYFCVYAEDFLWNASTIVSDNTFNIDNSQPSIVVTDNFGVTPVQTGNVSIIWSNLSGNIMYKYVSDIANCDNNAWTIYTEVLTITNENLNGQYICAYASGNVSGVFTTGVSNQINLDNTSPTLVEITHVSLYTNDDTPDYTFSSNEPGTISYQGDCSSSTTSASSGDNTITFNTLSEWLHNNCIISVTDAAGNTWNLNVSGFTVDTTDPVINGFVDGGEYTWTVSVSFTEINFSGATVNWANMNNGASFVDTGSYLIVVQDLAWNINSWSFRIVENIIPDTTNPTVSLSGPTNGSTTTGTSNIFSWIWSDNIGIASYNIYINWPTVYTGIWVTSPLTVPLSEGNYTWYVLATDTSWNTWQSSTWSFTMTTEDITSPVVELIYPTSWLVVTGNTINLQWSGSDNVAIDYYDVYLSGNSTNTTFTWLSTTSQNIATIENWNYSWYVIAHDVNRNTWISNEWNFVISGNNDSPTLLSPISGSNIELWDLLLIRTWSASDSGFMYQISTNTWFTNIVDSGNVEDDFESVIYNNPNFMTWTFYWRVVNVETSGISDYRTVNLVTPSEWLDLEVDEFDFDKEDDADVAEFYESNTITIEWINDNIYIPAKLDDNVWALFINDIMVWSEWLVKQWDEVYIELLSSKNFNDSVYAELIVWSGDNEVSDKFRVETRTYQAELELSYSQRLQAVLLLEAIVDMFDNKPEKLENFLDTLQIVLRDKSDIFEEQMEDAEGTDFVILLGKKASVDYLYDLVQDYLDDMSYIATDVYTAPNGKKYLVKYDTDKYAYTSPDFMYEKFFPTWEYFTSHIDINNMWPYFGIGKIDGENITAPNEKTYVIKQENGKWTSDAFINKKYFDTREQIIDYIFANNPAITWDHKVDWTFDTITYEAPNGKEYVIYKTSLDWNNPNMYFSFKFITPKYFNSLESIKMFIDKNNK